MVQPSDTWVATQWEGSWLTLTTCTPRFSSSSRLIVFARLVDRPNEETIHSGRSAPAPERSDDTARGPLDVRGARRGARSSFRKCPRAYA